MYDGFEITFMLMMQYWQYVFAISSGFHFSYSRWVQFQIYLLISLRNEFFYISLEKNQPIVIYFFNISFRLDQYKCQKGSFYSLLIILTFYGVKLFFCDTMFAMTTIHSICPKVCIHVLISEFSYLCYLLVIQVFTGTHSKHTHTHTQRKTLIIKYGHHANCQVTPIRVQESHALDCGSVDLWRSLIWDELERHICSRSNYPSCTPDLTNALVTDGSQNLTAMFLHVV